MIRKLSITKIKGKKVLAIGAHPDDLEFAAGGTINLLSRRNIVTLLIGTDGEAGGHDPGTLSARLAVERQKEALRAAKILGASETIFLKYPDLQLRDYRRRLFKEFLHLLLAERPDIIITWDFWGKYELYVHPDHRVIAEVVMEAVLESTLPGRLRQWGIYNARVLSPKPQQWLMIPESPNYVVDITAVWQTKRKALLSHKSQSPTIMKEEMLKKHALPSGKLIGVDKGESFRILSSHD